MQRENIILITLSLLTLFVACDKSKVEFEKVTKIGTIQVYQDFISKYPKSKFIQEATTILDSLNFQEVLKMDSIPFYEDFIVKNPMSAFVKNANSRVEEIRFEQVKKNDRIEEYQSFIDHYPQSRFILETNNRIIYLKSLPPSYTDVLASYPPNSILTKTKATISKIDNSSDDNFMIDTTHEGEFVEYMLTAEGLKPCVFELGTKLTVKDKFEYKGKTYMPGDKLTVDKDKNIIKVRSWK
jgi:hypothetical protein